MAVAILGLGIIGSAWAKNLQADGLEVRTWNRTPKEFPGFESDLPKAVEGAKTVIVVVSDPPAVEAVLNGILPVLKPGQTVIQSSTISTRWTLTFAERVRNTGAAYVEAPFTGSKPAAESRKTVFYLGGDTHDIEPVLGLLKHLSSHRMHIGPMGTASALKLAMNMNIAMVMQALSESLSFARAEGISDDVYFDALRINGSRSGISDLKEPVLKSGDFAPMFSLKHMDKDLRLALEDANDLRLPQLRVLKQFYQEGMAAGLGDSDFSVLAKLT